MIDSREENFTVNLTISQWGFITRIDNFVVIIKNTSIKTVIFLHALFILFLFLISLHNITSPSFVS